MAPLTIPRAYFVGRAFFADHKSAPWRAAHPLILAACDWTPTNKVQITTHTLKHPRFPRRWHLPWRRAEYSWELAISVEQIRNERVWRLVLEDTKDSLSEVASFRGGGASRHMLWSINLGHSNEFSFQLAKLLPTTDDTDADENAVLDVWRTYFRVVGTSPAIFGDGRLVRVSSDIRGSWDIDYPDNFADAYTDHLFGVAKDHGWFGIPAVTPTTYLGGAIVKRLGGVRALRARFDAMCDDAIAAGSIDPEFPATMPRAPEVCGNGMLAMYASGVSDTSALRYELHDTAAQRLLWWLMDELIAANLFLPARTGRIAEANRLTREYRAKVASGEINEPGSRTVDSARSIAEYAGMIRTLQPRCVTQGQVAKDCPKRFAPNRVIWRIGNLLHSAHPVYGVAVKKDPTALAAPILVGSLRPERAALHFDTMIHGWDGQQNHARPSRRRLTQFECPSCRGRLFKTWAAFEHDGSPSELPVDDPENCPNPQDYFTWFTLVTKCVACGETGMTCDEECA